MAASPAARLAEQALARVARDYPESGLDHRVRWEMALAGLMAGRFEAALEHLDVEGHRHIQRRAQLLGELGKRRMVHQRRDALKRIGLSGAVFGGAAQRAKK